MIIGVVGPCGAGKSSLVAGLNQNGYTVRHIAQEHSYVPDMWRRISHPDVLIYLQVSYENTVLRRNLDWTIGEFAEQIRRLQHAREHADLIINTDELNTLEVLSTVIRFIESGDQRSVNK